MTAARGWRIVARALPDAGVVAGLTALVVLPVWPGVFTIDSQAMLRAAREGQISNWYAPVLQWIWGIADGLGLPIASAATVATVGLITALLACSRLALGRVGSWIVAALVMAFPPVYGLAGWVGRDIWFTALALGTVALLGWGIVLPDRRRILFAAASITAWLGADARQNGFPLLIVVGGAAGWAWAQRRGRLALAIVAGSVTWLTVGVASLLLVQAAVITREYEPAQILYYNDLIAVSLRRNEYLVPHAYRREVGLPAVRELWVPGQVGAIVYLPDGPVRYEPYRAGSSDGLARAWLATIARHPIDYAVVRSHLWLQLVGLRPGARSAWFERSDLLPWTGSPELGQVFPRLADVRSRYLDSFDGSRGLPGPIHAAWIFLTAGILGSLLLVYCGPPACVLGWATMALQTLLQIALFFMAPLAEYRFQYPQVMLGIITLVLGVRVLVAQRRGGRSTPRLTRASRGRAPDGSGACCGSRRPPLDERG